MTQHIELYPASALAQNLGIKMLMYSPAGIGKTPLCVTAPAPVLGAVEPGLLSLRNSNIPCAPCFDHRSFVDYCNWICKSQEANQYYTFFIDSISQACDNFLDHCKANNSHGKKAYGELFDEMYPIVKMLYYAPGRNIVMTCKEEYLEIDGVNKARPYFPGKALPIAIPHLFDMVLRFEVTPQNQKVIRTAASFNAVARDRSGKLLELEQPSYDAMFRKIMA